MRIENSCLNMTRALDLHKDPVEPANSTNELRMELFPLPTVYSIDSGSSRTLVRVGRGSTGYNPAALQSLNGLRWCESIDFKHHSG